MSPPADIWNAATYAQFSDERSRPFFDLVGRIRAETPLVVVDVGCGDGSTTATLAERWPAARIVGVDSSADMLAGAAGRGIETVHADAVDWEPDTAVDVLVTNAMLQWIPDHTRLLSRWADRLAPGGWLAMQVPGNFDAPSHVQLRELAESPPWRDRLRGVLRHADAVLDATGYRRVLAGAGMDVDAWETTYLQVLDGPDPVLRWSRGTALRPVFAALGTASAEFEEQYAALLRQAYPRDADGRTEFPFRRVFAVAHHRTASETT